MFKKRRIKKEADQHPNVPNMDDQQQGANKALESARRKQDKKISPDLADKAKHSHQKRMKMKLSEEIAPEKPKRNQQQNNNPNMELP